MEHLGWTPRGDLPFLLKGPVPIGTYILQLPRYGQVEHLGWTPRGDLPFLLKGPV